MPKQVQIYYLQDSGTRTIFWTDDEEKLEVYQSFEFIGSSMNPNKRMAVASFMSHTPADQGWKIRELS